MANNKKRHSRQSIRSSQAQKRGNQPTSAQASLEIVEGFSGPIPHPQLLQQYDQICPGAADRIIRTMEQEAAHRHAMEGAALRADIIDTRIGQTCAFIIVLATLGIGAYTAINGAPITGGIFGTSGVLGVVATFIYGRRKRVNTDGQP